MTYSAPHNEWNELDAAVRSEAMLRDVMRGKSGSCTPEDLRRVERDAMRAMAVGIPDAVEFARWLETAHPNAAETLRGAYRSTSPKGNPYLRVEGTPWVPLLRSIGVLEAGGFGVGAFGNSVRKNLLGLEEVGGESE